MEHLTRGQLAQAARVNMETLRYYERRGLIDEPERNESGYRIYPPEMIIQIRFIKRAQELGFSLAEISELLSLRGDTTGSCDEVKKRAEGKVADIEQKIQTLQRMQDILNELIELCTCGELPPAECRILKAIEGEM
jgi:Hg(II)-responsive transcriptional regulator